MNQPKSKPIEIEAGDTKIRLNKFLAERLGFSRREADSAIEKGLVSVNEKPASIGVKVDKNDKVCYNGKIVPFSADFSYLAFHKPVGFVCSRKAQGSAPTLYDLLPKEFQRLKTVGRLDKDSSGLILLTNDGDFAFQMTHPKFRKTKTYEVVLDHDLAPLHQQLISDFGVEIGDGLSQFKIIHDDTEPESSRTQFTVFLTEGRNRQIRRTFTALGYEVIKLHRIQFGKYKLGNLPAGKYAIIKP